MAFDPIVANPGRLEILTALAAEQGQEFVRLRHRTGLTDGNLASHARRLAGAGLIEVEKRFRDSKPVTTYLLTSAGRAALDAHVGGLLAAINTTAARHDSMPDALAESSHPIGSTASEDEDWID